MGRRSSTFRTYSFTGHCFRYHVRKNKSGRYLIGSNLDTFCRNCIRSFQSEPGRTSVAFLKEFGLILFVYSVGLQVGPGFFSAFKKGGFTLNLLAMMVVFLGVTITIILHFITGVPITTMVGILSGAVTNTPGLGAAQQANSDLNGIDAPEIALGYAVAYPLGVLGCILSLLALKYILRINTKTEEADAERGLGHLQELTVRPISLEIRNEAVEGKTIKEIKPLVNRDFVISRIRHCDGDKQTELVNSTTVFHMHDEILVIANPIDVEAITVFLENK